MASIPTTKPETRVSSDAIELLDCFAEGLDRVVLRIAADIAKSRGEDADGSVKIELEDMRRAGEILFVMLEGQVTSGALPDNLRPAIAAMRDCFQQEGR